MEDKDILTPLLTSVFVAIFVNLSGILFFPLAQSIYSFALENLPVSVPPPNFQVDLLKYTSLGILLSPSTLAQSLIEIYNILRALRSDSWDKLFMLVLSLLTLLNIWVSCKHPKISLRISLTLGVSYALFLFVAYLKDIIIAVLESVNLIIISP